MILQSRERVPLRSGRGLGLPLHVLDDCVSVEVFGGKGQQDVERGGGRGTEPVRAGLHNRIQLDRTPT
jgi:hypothetical protein